MRGTRCCSRRGCRWRRRCWRRWRRRWSGPAFTSACGANGDDFFVWGTTREVPAFCLVVEVVASGLIVVKHRSEPFGKFVNVAVLEGDQIKIVDEGVGRLIPDCPDLVASLTGAIDHRSASGVTAVLIQLAASMRQHGRGGALLVVPTGTDGWRDSILAPVLYAIDPPYSELAELVRAKNADPDDLKRAVDAIAGLTAVDGATIINDRYDLLAFGAKITRAARQPAGRVRQRDRAGRRQRCRRGRRRRCSAARVTCRRRSSCTTSTTRWRWWRRRTAASRSSSGRTASSTCTRIASTRCCSRRAPRLCLRERRPRRAAAFPPAPAAPSGSAAARSQAAAPCPRSSAGRRDR